MNQNTYNDVQVILDCDGTVCVPCAGIPCNVIAFIADPVASLTCQSLNNGIILDGTGSSLGADINYEWIFSNTTIGNDLTIEVFQEGNYSLQVTDNSSGCSEEFSINVSVPVVTLFPQIDIANESCENEADGSIVINMVTGGQPPYLYTLNSNPFGLDAQFTNLSPGVYDLTIQDSDGCEYVEEINIFPAQTLELDLGDNQSISLGDSLELTPFTNLIIDSIVWDFEESLSCTDCFQPFVQPLNETTYTLTLVDVNGCVITDQIVIFVDKTQKVYIPNAFSPNDDGRNDHFMIYAGPDVSKVNNFRVYDRWGAIMYSVGDFFPNDSQYGWDGTFKGKFVNPGVYIYIAEIEFVDGRTEVISGDVTITK